MIRTFNVPKSPVYRFDYYRRYRTLWTGCSMCSRPQYADRSCGPIYPIFNTDRPMANRNLLALWSCLQGTWGLRLIFLCVPHILTKLMYPLWGGYKTILKFSRVMAKQVRKMRFNNTVIWSPTTLPSNFRVFLWNLKPKDLIFESKTIFLFSI